MSQTTLEINMKVFSYHTETKRYLYSVNMPNKETIAAMKDANNGKVERYDSLKSMWADLNNN